MYMELERSDVSLMETTQNKESREGLATPNPYIITKYLLPNQTSIGRYIS
jgi:hypothetical protein